MSPVKPKISIHYCSLCRWLLRASWLAQELLFTFDDELAEVALCPGLKGGFDIYVNDELVWSRQQEGRFPEAKEIKQRVRDIIAPERELGHSDR
ncbi:SelT/SelW/SelH family protein [Celerinatantimonas yamalensis]|uniref:SelT/SelW/SelH family protein n=1 Tax=Celerinatantimonas yamalensis TaxID=559956 RepID=A0ABW9G3G3_9GAMM